MKNKRELVKHGFNLDLNKPNEARLHDMINWLKGERQWTRELVDALTIIFELKYSGNPEPLYMAFPMLRTRSPGSEVQLSVPDLYIAEVSDDDIMANLDDNFGDFDYEE